jgi:hypothetical protein
VSPSDKKVSLSSVAFTNYDEKEEASCISQLNFVKLSYLKALLLVPILSVLTIFILPIVMYWRPTVYARMLFSPVNDIKNASHVVVKGRGAAKVVMCKL